MSRGRGQGIGPILAVLLVLAVVALAVLPRVVGGKGAKHPAAASTPPNLKTVRVLAGSETEAYLDDPAVAQELAKHGYQLQVDTAGSQAIVSRDDLKGQYDIALPSDATEADRIKARYHVTQSYVPFSTPMAIATFQSVEDVLTASGLTTVSKGVTLFDMKGYLQRVADKTRWSTLPGGTALGTDKSVLISSTSLQTSNSAALYLAIASYVTNGDTIVSDQTTAKQLGDRLAPLFLLQGFQGSSTQQPFDQYLTLGRGATPMVMIYESQFRGDQIKNDGSIAKDMKLMYPNPTIFAKHTVVPLTADGDAVGRLLTTDPTLQELAAHDGFRPADPTRQTSGVNAKIPPPPSLDTVTDPPTEEISATMIGRINAKYTATPG